jgi:transposase
MYARELGSIPEEPARVARAACPKGTLAMRLRDELGELYQDEHFVSLYPIEGQPAYEAWRLAIVTVLQYAEGLTDRQAANAVGERIDWKYALGLELTNAGFDFSVLSEFRARLGESQQETLLLDRLLEVCKERGWLKAGGKQRTDSTHVLARVRSLSNLECVGEMVRAVLDDLATLAPEWLIQQISPDWFERDSHRVENYRLRHPRQASGLPWRNRSVRMDGICCRRWKSPRFLRASRTRPVFNCCAKSGSRMTTCQVGRPNGALVRKRTKGKGSFVLPLIQKHEQAKSGRRRGWDTKCI